MGKQTVDECKQQLLDGIKSNNEFIEEVSFMVGSDWSRNRSAVERCCAENKLFIRILEILDKEYTRAYDEGFQEGIAHEREEKNLEKLNEFIKEKYN